MLQKILFVDDEPNVIHSLKRILRKEPYQILWAYSGDEALHWLAQHTVDVVVSDAQMPGMSGTELLRRVSEKYPETIRIILTGNANIDMAIRAINEGQVYRFLRKPCHEWELVSTIRAALKQREFLMKTKQLLKLYRQQSDYVARLEQKFPGISEVEKDEEGVVILTDVSNSYDSLIREIEKEIINSKR